jgi:hypothetical protein
MRSHTVSRRKEAVKPAISAERILFANVNFQAAAAQTRRPNFYQLTGYAVASCGNIAEAFKDEISAGQITKFVHERRVHQAART